MTPHASPLQLSTSLCTLRAAAPRFLGQRREHGRLSPPGLTQVFGLGCPAGPRPGPQQIPRPNHMHRGSHRSRFSQAPAAPFCVPWDLPHPCRLEARASGTAPCLPAWGWRPLSSLLGPRSWACGQEATQAPPSRGSGSTPTQRKTLLMAYPENGRPRPPPASSDSKPKRIWERICRFTCVARLEKLSCGTQWPWSFLSC